MMQVFLTIDCCQMQANHQTGTGRNRPLNAIRPCFACLGLNYGRGLMHLFHIIHTHIRKWQLLNSETPLTFST